MRVALYIPPHVDWFSSITKDIEKSLILCGDINELSNYHDVKKIVVDNLVGTDSEVRTRILDYQKIADQVIILNSEVPINIVEQCQTFDFKNVVLCITGKVNYEPKHLKIVRHENFFACVQQLYSTLQYKPLTELDPYSVKPYFFDALLGLEKPQRTWISDQISVHCPDKIYKTYYRTREQLATKSSEFFNWPTGVEIIDTPYATSNDIRYFGEWTWISHVIPVDIYNQCAYSIISETYDDNSFSFYTEKTAKALLSQRLFVMFAGAEYLKNLRELGFKTFDGIIDESYDLEVDQTRRHQMAFDQVKALCNRDQAAVIALAKPIIEHNYNLFMSKDWMRDYRETLHSIILT